MSKRSTAWQGIEKTQQSLLLVLALCFTLLVFVQVILRYLFHHPLMGIEELVLFPCIWLYFLGSAYASWRRAQIKAQVLDLFLKGRRSVEGTKIVTGVIVIGLCGWLTYWAYDFFVYAISVAKLSPTLYIPLVYAECSSSLVFY